MAEESSEIEINDSIDEPRNPAEPSDGSKIIVKRGVVDSVTIYEVSESELQILEMGSPSSIFLNIFTFVFGIFLSFLTTLLTVDLNDKVVLMIIFIVIAVVTGFLSLIMIIFWFRGRHEFSDVITRIKDRVH